MCAEEAAGVGRVRLRRVSSCGVSSVERRRQDALCAGQWEGRGKAHVVLDQKWGYCRLHRQTVRPSCACQHQV